jgi:hypothetical protein
LKLCGVQSGTDVENAIAFCEARNTVKRNYTIRSSSSKRMPG